MEGHRKQDVQPVVPRRGPGAPQETGTLPAMMPYRKPSKKTRHIIEDEEMANLMHQLRAKGSSWLHQALDDDDLKCQVPYRPNRGKRLRHFEEGSPQSKKKTLVCVPRHNKEPDSLAASDMESSCKKSPPHAPGRPQNLYTPAPTPPPAAAALPEPAPGPSSPEDTPVMAAGGEAIQYQGVSRHRNPRLSNSEDYDCLSFTTTLEILAILLLGMAIAVGIFTRSAIAKIEIHQPGVVATLFCQNCTRTLEKIREHLCDKPEHPTSGQLPCKLCPNAWKLSRNNCYFFSDGPETWNASRKYCQMQGSNLLTVQHDSEMDLLDNMEEEVDFFWTGYQYNATEKRWFWPIEFPDLGYKMKMPSSDSAINRHSCGAYRKRGIHHASCTSLYRWICKKKAFQLSL